ncbi:hypothetical protein BH24CHL4_BH24CHL4_22790 [soil metagenome]
MSLNSGSSQTQERLTKLALMGLFSGLIAALAPGRKSRLPPNLSSLDFTMLGLAAFRMGRMTAYDVVAEPVREPFVETVEDPSGAGMTTEPKGTGARKVVGELMSCPICAGTWAAGGLVYGLRVAPAPTRLFLAIMSAAGVAEVLNSAVEAMQWSAQVKREEVEE